MSRAGFVLLGGQSSRMGTDKALLPFRGGTLGSHIAAIVASAAGPVTLIGDPKKYACLGYPVIADRVAGLGPAGGIETALQHTVADWNLVVACDMPGLSQSFLLELLDTGEQSGADAILCAGPTGQLEPLCAVYHRRCRDTIRRALDSGVRKVTDALAGLRVDAFTTNDVNFFQNCNTPSDWDAVC